MFLMNKSSQMGEYGGSATMSSSPFNDISPWAIAIAAIVAFVIAIILLVTVVQRKKAPQNKFFRWLREYLNFRSILISGIIKFVYLFLSVFLTIASIIVMCSGKDEMALPMLGIGLAILVLGNIFLRIMMEMTMAVIVIWENTSDIRGVLVKAEEMPEEKKPKAPKEEKKVEEAPKIEEVKVEQQPEVPVVEEPQPEVSQSEASIVEVSQSEVSQPETPQPEAPQNITGQTV